MRLLAKPGSLASSSLWKRTFSSISTSPRARAEALRRTSAPRNPGHADRLPQELREARRPPASG
jgi:hypothetical protein